MDVLSLSARARDFCRAWYDAPERAYHNAPHVEQVIGALRDRGVLSPVLELAAWGHDLIYDPRADDNEARSAAAFCAWLEAQNVGSQTVSDVHALILATRHETAPTTREAALFVDADLSVFGAPDPAFWAYEAAIRQEYGFVPDAMYRAGRAAVLTRFLTRARIYSTPEFTDLEAAARQHLQAALRRLQTL